MGYEYGLARRAAVDSLQKQVLDERRHVAVQLVQAGFRIWVISEQPSDHRYTASADSAGTSIYARSAKRRCRHHLASHVKFWKVFPLT